MVVERRPYWMKSPSARVMGRLARIAELVEGRVRTVRNITYRLYPDTHGQDLERRYNTTIKDVVRGRVLGLVPWDHIREERVERHSPDGWTSAQAYLDHLLDPDQWKYYSKSKREAHRVPLEVWFEKATVEPEFRHVCNGLDIPFMSTRGQLTWTAKKASERLQEHTIVLYFGDNDEKGHEIAAVIRREFAYLGVPATLEWSGVTPEQEGRFHLPPGARLDGFDLEDLETIIVEQLAPYIDGDRLQEILAEEEQERQDLRTRWEAFLGGDDR